MKIAIAHDYLTQLGGAERVVLSILKAFPGAALHTTLYERDHTFPEFADVDMRVSGLNRAAYLRRNHRAALPLLPAASSAMRIDADLVIASSAGWAHGFRTDGRMLVYCHSPARWLYLAEDYLGDRGRSPSAAALRAIGPALRRWDQNAAARADLYLANSHVVQDRIKNTYDIDAEVLFPPHRVDNVSEQQLPLGFDSTDPGGFHLLVSRLMPYKNVDQATAAFAQLPGERLVVVGSGPLGDRLRATAPSNVTFREGVSDAELRWLYAHAAALVAPAFEDFGLSVIEAAAYGTPALALRAGGYLDTVRNGESGWFFDHPEAADIALAVRHHRAATLDRKVVAEHAAAFGEDRFVRELQEYAERVLTSPRPAQRAT